MTLFALVMVIAVGEWHVKKYSVVGGALLLRSGLVNRSVRVVPISRVATLTAFQSMAQRLIGVWQVNVQAPGDRIGSVVTLACLSGSQLDELRAALRSGDGWPATVNPDAGLGLSTLRRYLGWRHTSVASGSADGVQVIAVLTPIEMVIAALTNYWIHLILLAGIVVWFQFSEYLPVGALEFMEDVVEPRGLVAILITLVAVAITVSIIIGALRLFRFTLIRDGDVLRSSSGLFGRKTAAVSAERVEAVRIVEGVSQILLGYCSLQVEIVGVGRTNINERVLFPLVRTDRAEALIRRALPELPAEPAPAGPSCACAPSLPHPAT